VFARPVLRHTARVRRRSATLALALLSCSPADPGESTVAGPSGPDDGSGTTGIILPPTTDPTPTEASTSTGPEPKFDLPKEQDLPDTSGGCGAVDILFVIDNSKSMGEYQTALAAAFPQFVDAMYSNLPAEISLHVGITTTDLTCEKPGDPCCPDACPLGNTGCQVGSTPEEIEQLEGFYDPPSKFNNGTNGGQGRLFEHEGQRFFVTTTSEDPAPLKQWFTGAAVAAGEQGSSLEMPIAAAAYAADPINDVTNAGFIRDTDAILLIVFLTNDPDASLESLDTYEGMVLAAKQGCPECVLTAGLLDACVVEEDQRLWRFMKAFGDEPIWRDITAKDEYAEVVGAALASTLVEACENIPVG
jgi:hypothetical protein